MKTKLHYILPALTALLFVGCATSTPRGSAQAVALRPPEEQIRWPAEYTPGQSAFFVHNQIDIAAPPEAVWDILTDVQAWPEWYVGATDLAVRSPDQLMGPDVVVSWRTMGLKFDSEVREWEPPTRFAWESRKSVIQGYHAWLIVPTETGSRLITDESFNGFLAYMQRTFIPNKLHGLHQIFLEELKIKAEAQVAAGS
ncbi:MAG: SRPBCC domain-containing protein [Opitutales bacterium]|nr:SRPBCC domain-containing protein [Opitutales bacterium]